MPYYLSVNDGTLPGVLESLWVRLFRLHDVKFIRKGGENMVYYGKIVKGRKSPVFVKWKVDENDGDQHMRLSLTIFVNFGPLGAFKIPKRVDIIETHDGGKTFQGKGIWFGRAMFTFELQRIS